MCWEKPFKLLLRKSYGTAYWDMWMITRIRWTLIKCRMSCLAFSNHVFLLLNTVMPTNWIIYTRQVLCCCYLAFPVYVEGTCFKTQSSNCNCGPATLLLAGSFVCLCIILRRYTPIGSSCFHCSHPSWYPASWWNTVECRRSHFKFRQSISPNFSDLTP